MKQIPMVCEVCHYLPAKSGKTTCEKCVDLGAEIQLELIASKQRQLLFRRTDVVAYL